MAYRSHQDELSDTDNPLTQISPEEEAQMEQNARQGLGGSGYSSDMAKRIRGAENAAAAGKPSLNMGGSKFGAKGSGNRLTDGNSSSLNNKLDKLNNNVRDKLKDKEGSGLYKPSSDDNGGGGGIKGMFSKLAGNRKKSIAAILISSLIGGGGGFATFGIVSGPLQFIHAGRLLPSIYQSKNDDQTDSRMLKLARNIYYASKDQTYRTRLSYLGNKYADRVEKKMNDRGIKTVDKGTFKGYTIDPSKLSSEDYPDMSDKSPEGVRKYLQEKYGINSEVVGNMVQVAPIGKYLADKKIMKAVMRFSGFKSLSWLAARFHGVRAGLTWHPIKKIDKKIYDTLEKRAKEWRKKQKEYVRNGARPPAVSANAATDKDGKPVTDEADSANETIQDAQEAAAADDAGDTGKINQFRESLGGKLTGGVLGLVGLVCILQSIAQRYDTISQQLIDLPQQRIASAAWSFGAQLEDGLQTDEEQVGFMADLYYSKEDGTTWSDARVLHAENGEKGGKDIPEGAKTNINGNWLTRFLGAIPGIDAMCSTAGAIVLIAAAAITGGILATAIAVAVGVATDLLIGDKKQEFIDWILKLLIGKPVDEMAAGAIRGGYMGIGSAKIANGYAQAMGGLPVDGADLNAIDTATRQSQEEEFQQHNLAYRLFDTSDPKSFFSQVIDKQAPDPEANVKRTATAFMNIGKSFGSVLASPFSSLVHASPGQNDYDYGFPAMMYSQTEMDNPAYDNPYANADAVADILDAEPDYIERAKTCFGVQIFKEQVTPDGGGAPYEQYAIKPPQTGDIPTYKTILDPANECLEGHRYSNLSATEAVTNWTRVRFFIFDSQVGNSMACYEGDEGDEDSQQACVDIGLEADPNAGNGSTAWDDSTGVPTCATTAVSSAPAGYHLTSCDDFEGTSLEGSTFGAYEGGGGDTVSGAGRKASQCTVANSFFTLTQGPDGATCGSASNFNQKEGYWEVRMRTAAIDGGSSSAHPVLILWPGSDRWNDGELDYFETDIGEDGGGYLHCVGPNIASNCFVIPGNGGNQAITPTAEDYKAKSSKSYWSWHSYGLMWKPDSMSGYIDGQQWWTSTDGSFRPSVEMHQTIQLDNLSGDGNPNPAQMQADWVHVYAQG